MPSLPKPRFVRVPRGRGPVSSPPSEPETSQVEVVEGSGVRWINIEQPRPSHRAWLEERFDFHPLDYEDVFSRNQRPKIDEYDDYLFIGPDFVVTLPNQPLQPVEYLFERCRTNDELRESWFSKGTGYLLYKIVDACVDASFPMLAKMGNKLERVEDEIFAGNSAEVVRDISNVKQEIINFRKVVRPQRAVFGDLERTKQRYLAEDLDVYFDDINDASERVWQMLETYKETVEALEATNESVLSHQLNDVLRVLTVLTVVFLPLTLIASIFGMNVKVPGEGQIEPFWIVVGLLVIVGVLMIGFFRKRHWL